MPRARPVEFHVDRHTGNKRESPRREAVASVPFSSGPACSDKREAPRDKPVASSTLCAKPSFSGANPTDGVGGLFIDYLISRLSMKHPPTASVGLGWKKDLSFYQLERPPQKEAAFKVPCEQTTPQLVAVNARYEIPRSFFD